MVEVGIRELTLFAQLYDEEGTPSLEARLPALHARTMVPTLRKFAHAGRLSNSGKPFFPSAMFDEARAVRDGTIRRETRFPSAAEDLVISGPHFFVAAPLYKTPRRVCNSNKAYDVVDLTSVPD